MSNRRRPAKPSAGKSFGPAAVPLDPRPTADWNSRSYLFLVLILAIAAFLRFYQFDTYPAGFYADEAMDGNNAVQALETGRFQVFYPENYGREGLFINLIAACVAIFGPTTWAVRLPSVIFGLLTVWATYRLTSVLFQAPAGLLAAFFMATSLWHIILARVDHRTHGAAFFLLMTIILLLAAMTGLRRGRSELPMMMCAGAVYGLGFHTYIAYRATPMLLGPLFLYWLLQARRDAWAVAYWKAVAAFVLTAAAVICPLAIYFIQHPEALVHRAAMISVFGTPHPLAEALRNTGKTAQMFFLNGDANWRQNVAGRPQLFLPVAILFALGVAQACAVLYQSLRRSSAASGNSFGYAVALGWIAVGALPTILSTDRVPNCSRSLIILPAVFMLTATGAVTAHRYLSQWLSPRARMVVCSVLLLALCYEPYYMYFHVWAPSPEVDREFDGMLVGMAQRINAVPATVPKYVVFGRNKLMTNGVPEAISPIAYLTKSYTRRDQKTVNIYYVAPPEGTSFDVREPCRRVMAEHPEARVFCVQ